MKKSAILAVSLLCLTAGAALAAGEGDGPYGPPETAASLPNGFLNGTTAYMGEQETYQASGEQTPPPDAAAAVNSASAALPAPATTSAPQVAP